MNGLSVYIEARYPGEMGLLPDGKPSEAEAHQFFDFAQNFYREALAACEAGK